jgi:uncharacterized membrane-anchored protein
MMLLPLMILAGLLSLVCMIWTLVRIGRDSPLLAVGTFLFFPLGFIHLFRHWGDERLDIRTPFLAWIAFSGLTFYAQYRAYNWAIKSVEADQALMASILSQVGKAESENDDLDRRLRIVNLMGSVSFVGGTVKLADANATIEVPAHFRYARREQLENVANAMGRTMTPGTIGWLVHDQVSLSEARPWLVEVHWYPLGHVAVGDTGRLAPANLVAERNRVMTQAGAEAPVDFEWLGFVYQPEWNSARGALAWAEQTRYEGHEQPLADCYADMPGRKGVLRYSVEFVDPERTELAFRAARLMATHTRFEQGSGPDDYSRLWDKNSGMQLADLASGAAFAQ